jgi:hypothetical protein
MFELVSGVGTGGSVDPELEDAVDWASFERELRSGAEDRTWGNTTPPDSSPWKSTPTPASKPACRMHS